MTDRTYILKTHGLTKKYGAQKANDNVSVSVRRGEIVGFVGRNGSGKTTFIRLITGLIRPTEGGFELKADGESETETGKVRMGAVVETPSFFKRMTGYENMLFQAKLTGIPEEKIAETMTVVGLDPKLGKKVKDYSLGMKQRLGIALALLSNPELLILDEPTNGMDPAGIIEMRDFLKKLAEEKNITVIVSSHILSELAMLATSFVFIDSGKIIERITKSELEEKLKKRMRICFAEGEDPSAALDECVAEGLAEMFYAEKDGYVLVSPKSFGKIFRRLDAFEITDVTSYSETLETYYMNMIGGDVHAQTSES